MATTATERNVTKEIYSGSDVGCGAYRVTLRVTMNGPYWTSSDYDTNTGDLSFDFSAC
ncbi:hypothetical protein [Streptomyces sp. NPDC008001]|uniref:hypothetical protein n=1 Tax=Streptomyces sp. NPDC008001 TaxID=3364804 RepID=UPI0036DFDA42